LLSPSGPGGEEYADREALAFHLYCPPGSNELLCDGIIDLAWDWLARTKKLMTVGTRASIMTEFGSVGDQPSDIRLLNKVSSAADEFLQSWFYWTYRSYGDITTQNPATETFFYPNGSVQELKVKALSTTYPHAVAGAAETIMFNMDRTTGFFELNYTTNAGNGGSDRSCREMMKAKSNALDTSQISCPNSTATVIFLNEKMWYPSGFTVTLKVLHTHTWVDAEKAGVLSWFVQTKNYIVVQHREGTVHKVRVLIAAN
jgi:hypothetical protein